MLSVVVPNRVLLVDDALEARAILEAHLTRSGFEVLTCAWASGSIITMQTSS